jgi:hypothetical protein
VRRLLSTRFGFFALAAIVSAVMTIPIDAELRWVPVALACLYGALALLFLMDDVGRVAGRRAPAAVPPSPYGPPPPPRP